MTQFFDEFSKAVGEESVPRRESLRRLGIAITATLLGPLGAQYAQAGKQPKPPKPPKPPQDPCKSFCTCSNKKQLDQCLKACKACGSNPSWLAGSCGSYFCCGDDQDSCGDYCADLANDPYNCGACGYECDRPGPNEYGGCLGGSCVYACVNGAVVCDDACTFAESDPDNCGACGVVCDSQEICVNGTCVGTDSDCPGGGTRCNGICTNLAFDTRNCGACGRVCRAGQTCSGGVCQSPW